MTSVENLYIWLNGKQNLEGYVMKQQKQSFTVDSTTTNIEQIVFKMPNHHSCVFDPRYDDTISNGHFLF